MLHSLCCTHTHRVPISYTLCSVVGVAFLTFLVANTCISGPLHVTYLVYDKTLNRIGSLQWDLCMYVETLSNNLRHVGRTSFIYLHGLLPSSIM